jgi:hypothetical protein
MGVVSVKAGRMDGTGRAYLTQPVVLELIRKMTLSIMSFSSMGI